jgi:hypothetical protein
VDNIYVRQRDAKEGVLQVKEISVFMGIKPLLRK